MSGGTLGADPLFITDQMMDQIEPYVTKVIKAVPSGRARQEGTVGMKFTPLEAHLAEKLPGVRAHAEVASVLAHAIKGLL